MSDPPPPDATPDGAALTAELQRSNAALEEFAYLCSHDLKEPLRGIHNYATFLKEDYGAQLDTAGCEKLDTLVRLARRMNEQIDALLEYSRAGRTQAAIAPTRIETVLGDVLETLGPALREHGVEVRVLRPLPRLVCDGVRLAEVFRNLIGNAIKYRRAQQPWIEIGCRSEPRSGEGASADWPLLSVRDNGIGIAEEHFRTIFRMFKRLHAQGAYGGGVGAGLALVERILAIHGGWIRVESVLGEGSCFWFCAGPSAGEPAHATSGGPPQPAGGEPPQPAAMPLPAPAPPPLAAVAAHAPTRTSAPPRIAAREDLLGAGPGGRALRGLVVDDDRVLLASFERALAASGQPWQLQFTSDPRAALATVSEGLIDVVVSDLNMPELPGDELLEEIRQHSPHTLRILMSSEIDAAAAVRSIGSSQRFLAKPCSPEELAEAIRTAFALRAYLGDPLLAGALGRIAKGPLFPGGGAELLEPTREIVRGGLQAARHLAARLLEQLRLGTAQGIDVNELWRRASRAAHCADRICAVERAAAAPRGHAVLASLLHELGGLVLGRYAPDLLPRAQRLALEKQLSEQDAERATFSATRDDVGAYVLGLWGFPDPVVEAVAFQRRPSAAPSPAFAPVSVVHVARALGHAPPDFDPARQALPGVDLAYLQRLGVADRLASWIAYSCD